MCKWSVALYELYGCILEGLRPAQLKGSAFIK